MINHKYNFGDKLKDKVSGYNGIVMGITKYSTECIHYGLASITLNNGKPLDWEWFDESRLILVKRGAVKFNIDEVTSGVFPDAPEH